MTQLTQEQYDRLKPLEGHFRTAVKANYKRATTRAEDELVINILKELGKSPYTTPSCGRCSFLNFQMLGQIYLEYTPQQPQQQTQPQQPQQQTQPQPKKPNPNDGHQHPQEVNTGKD